ncbi:MAG TPA: hypothetical protein VFD49_13475 [Candidatus Dormibacteraeota bacterium]|nr:hypothetical protein [Candidatus Dormibacteraeota bacterium]
MSKRKWVPNEAYRALRRREGSLLDPARDGYIGRVLMEAYGKEWPSHFASGVTAMGPGLPSTIPLDGDSARAHAEELERIATLLTDARAVIEKEAVPISSLPPEARGATPWMRYDDPEIVFLGRVVVEFWEASRPGAAIETPTELVGESRYRFAIDCIDKVLPMLLSRARQLRGGQAG